MTRRPSNSGLPCSEDSPIGSGGCGELTCVGTGHGSSRGLPDAGAGTTTARSAGPEDLLVQVARGDQAAFEALCRLVAPPVFGVVRAVVRDRFQAEEVCQEVLLEVWRCASRFQPGRGSAMAWVTTIAHRRAVDRVRAEQRAADRHRRAATHQVDYDAVTEHVEARLDAERVRRCLDFLTPLQRESVTLAYYGGYTFREVALLLGVPEGTVKTRMRDGLIRLRDYLGADP
jgi:RNA polymerase sigma-70 factor, ECF subfamily